LAIFFGHTITLKSFDFFYPIQFHSELRTSFKELTLVHFQLGGASCGLAVGVGDPARVLTGVSGHGLGQLKGEVVLLGHDLGPVGYGAIQRLVVL